MRRQYAHYDVTIMNLLIFNISDPVDPVGCIELGKHTFIAYFIFHPGSSGNEPWPLVVWSKEDISRCLSPAVPRCGMVLLTEWQVFMVYKCQGVVDCYRLREDVGNEL